jgi:hypothetical protein
VKRIVILIVAGLMFGNAYAQDDAENIQVLPEEAQNCVLPAAPDAISEEATYDDLVAAKKQIGVFQEQVIVYRECLQAAEANPENTPGNNAAIVAAFNYTVEMEERVAERFNVAVRGYKERKAAAEG